MTNKPYLAKPLQSWDAYPQAKTGMPNECVDCTYDGMGTQYCSKFQQEEIERQWSMHCSGQEPETTEQFFLDCPKALHERLEETRNRQLW
jgi:hypothetical protein